MTLVCDSLLNNRYRIVEVLGQGGMAAVYRAIDENLGVEVAVKENLFTTEEYARQFRLEATILASLRQANLPRVSDHFVIEAQGQYLVMDFIEGEDLRERLDRLGALPEQEVIIIGVAMCDALAYMHSRTPMILHRDIKPGNVRITPSGHIYLVDFGLAKMVEGREATNTGARAMTPGYSPPEQYGTARTDARSDIYSLGATLYCALTNTIPEDGLERAMYRKALTPILNLNPKVSENVASIIEKCLAIQPPDRYQTAEELRFTLMEARSVSRRKLPLELVLQPPPMTIHERLPVRVENSPQNISSDSLLVDGVNKKSTLPLDQVDENIELSPVNYKSKRSTPVWLFLALLPIIILSGVAAYIVKPELARQAVGYILPGFNPSLTPTEIGPTNTVVPIVALVSKTPTGTSSPAPSLEPSNFPTATYTTTPSPTITPTAPATPMAGAKQIAFVSNRTGAMELWMENLDGSGLAQITDIPEGACQPNWSPDGVRLIFVSPCTLNRISYPGASLFIINADGSGMMPLPSVPGGDYDPVWSPDGSEIAFTSLREAGMPKVFIMEMSDYSVRTLIPNASGSNSQPAWSPDGKMIAYVNNDNRIWAIGVNGQDDHALTVGGGDYLSHEPAWSPDGSAVIFTWTAINDTTGTTKLLAVPYTEEGALPVPVPNSLLVSEVSYSPDGYWLLFTSWYSGNHDINIMRPNGNDRQAIVENPAYDFDPVWRPLVVNQP